MHTRIPPMFKVSVLAVAVVTLSGCAVKSEPSRIGETIMDAGRVTAGASVKAYEGTKRFLGFDRDSQAPMDEVDLALMSNDEWPTDEASDVVVRPAKTISAQGVNILEGAEPPPVGAPAIATMPAVDPNAIQVATVDYNHVVGPNETMWTIAKATTGNANNWRILAEINQLDLNTPMQIGQDVLIPADLVLPEMVTTALAPTTPAADIENTAAPILTLDADPLAELAPLEIELENSDSIEPIAQTDLESDPLSPDAALGAGEGREELIVADARDAVEEDIIDPTLNAVALKVDVAETLWDMAKRTTGDATNWKAIAAHNGFTEKDIGRIRYGQTVHVPSELAKTEFGGDNVVAAKAALPETDSDADATATDSLVAATTTELPAEGSTEEAVDASATLVANSSNLMDETQEIKIVEAKFQSDEAIQLDNPAIAGAADGSGEVIMVSGTYYPKAVYNEADFSSSLLMRVSPGTEMTVSKAMGPWYEVQTEFGIGYMHSRDIK